MAETLGYCIRLRPTGQSPDWREDERRAMWLLRPDVPFPLSADDRVWGGPEDDFLLSMPCTFRDVAFASLGAALEACRTLSSPSEWVVLELRFHCHLPSDVWLSWPPVVSAPEGGVSEGLDIITNDGFSMLANFRLPSDALTRLRSEWGVRLNERHLLTSAADALALVTVLQPFLARAPSHGPLHVVELRTYAVP